MHLSRTAFLEVVDRTPLVSIDLVVQRPSGEVLLGLRTNAPAQGFWFAPGGRIRKNERLAAAFQRITQAELGVEIALTEARFLGLYDHLYPDDNFAGAAGIDTHYVVLAHVVPWPEDREPVLDQQHTSWRWAAPAQILADPTVHENTRAYFR